MTIEGKRQLGIYVHIPFCVRKCNYCDFLSAPADRETRRRYVEQLQEEIRQFEAAREYQVRSIFFGGGTPSLLEGEELAAVMEQIRKTFCLGAGQSRKKEDAKGSLAGQKTKTEETIAERSVEILLDKLPEVTVECNPGTLTEEKLKIYRQCGINRLSLGLQSGDNEELKNLGRIHTWEEFADNYLLARELGFSNINVDLMSSLPGQTLTSWQSTLEKVLALRPEHISAYSLIIEEGTPFFDRYGEQARAMEQGGPRGQLSAEEAARAREQGEVCEQLYSGEKNREGEREASGDRLSSGVENRAISGDRLSSGVENRAISGDRLPSEEEDREMYYETSRRLKEAGLYRYEISNYARPGFESVHNCGYWQRREYVGFGLGASSQTDHLRYKNTEKLEDYLKGDFSKQEILELSKKDEIEETMYLGLRMMRGVSLASFQKQFGVPMEMVYGKQLEKLERQGLILRENGYLKLTEYGIDVSNPVLAEFLLDEVG